MVKFGYINAVKHKEVYMSNIKNIILTLLFTPLIAGSTGNQHCSLLYL